jgi:hypothetical protein
MIPHVEIIDKYTLKPFALVEPNECWFELSYYEVGEFEVYAKANTKNLAALKIGHYVKIPNKKYLWVITSIEYTFTAGGARMISAKGKEAKYLLSKRIILTPKELQGTITNAIYGLVNQNIGTGASAARKVVGFTVDTNNLLIDITGTQAPRGNLLEFVSNLLKQYNCGSICTYEGGLIRYSIINGDVKTDNIIFSQSFDNLLASNYLINNEELATYALVVSTVDDIDYVIAYANGGAGIDRAEILINSNLSTKYEDVNGVEQETTPTSLLYKGWQTEEAKKELSNNIVIEECNGEIDLKHSVYEFETDFFIGDMVKVRDEYFNFELTPRILKYTFSQAATYSEAADYGK